MHHCGRSSRQYERRVVALASHQVSAIQGHARLVSGIVSVLSLATSAHSDAYWQAPLEVGRLLIDAQTEFVRLVADVNDMHEVKAKDADNRDGRWRREGAILGEEN